MKTDDQFKCFCPHELGVQMRTIQESHFKAGGERREMVFMDVQGHLLVLYPFNDIQVCQYLETVSLSHVVRVDGVQVRGCSSTL